MRVFRLLRFSSFLGFIFCGGVEKGKGQMGILPLDKLGSGYDFEMDELSERGGGGCVGVES